MQESPSAASSGRLGDGASQLSSPGPAGGGTGHSNIYVRNLPMDFSEDDLSDLFSAFGTVSSCRIAKQPHTQASKGFGFIKLDSVEAAEEAIAQLNGTVVGEAALEVKHAENDMTQRASGQVPGDNLYCRGINPDWSQQAVVQQFEPYGTVVDCRILASSVATGKSALVRMATPEQAADAIQGIAAQQHAEQGPRLFVRYADTAEEKRAKRASKASPRPGSHVSHIPQVTVEMPPPGRSASSHNEAISMPDGIPDIPIHNYPGIPQMPSGNPSSMPAAMPAGMSHDALLQALPPNATASLYVKNLPQDADRLFLYQHFAPHGAILSVRVLVDPASSQPRGVGFVNYASPLSALAAVQALHGQRVGDRDAKALHVSLQTLGQARKPSRAG